MKKLIWLLIVLVLLFFLAKGWWNSQLAAVSSDKDAKIFVIRKGETLGEIADDLKKQHLVKNSWAFIIYGKQASLGSKIQAGSFKLSAADSVSEIFKIITNQPLAIWVRLLEGWRKEEIADELTAKLSVSAKYQIQRDKLLKIAQEGQMFPDTYLFEPDVTEEQVVQKLTDNFNQKYTADLRSKIKALGLTEQEGVILASIVEREARSEEAKTKVASILLKRLKIGMGLNADSTIQYALGYQAKEMSWWKRQLSREDLQVDSAYNTYLHAGLPPGAICNPGLVSLRAVANADPNIPYLYYYHDSNGVSHYAKTLEEHNQNVADYP